MITIRVDKNFLFNILLSLGSSFLLLGILLGGLTGSLNLALVPRIVEILRSTLPAFIGCYLAAGLAQSLLRAIRYRVILQTTEKQVPGLLHILLVTMSRNMFVDMLPARLGELSYIAMLNRGLKVRAEACLSSLAISFVFDLVALGLLLAGLLMYQMIASTMQPWLIGALLLVVVLSTTLLCLLFPVMTSLGRQLGKVKTIRNRLVRKTVRCLEMTAETLQKTRETAIIFSLLSLSLGIRLAKYLGLYFLFLGVVLPNFNGVDTSPAPVFFTLISAEASASLPVPSFMSFGTYEAGGALAMTTLGLDKGIASLLLLSLHIWSQVIDYSLGIAGLIVFFFAISRARNFFSVGSRRRNRGAVFAVCIFLCAGLVFLGQQVQKVRKLGSFSAPQPGIAVQRGPNAFTSTHLKDLHGFVVWSSNRFGNHDIVMLSLPDQKLSRLTTNPHTEYFPRISPDGTRIVFCRSQIPWVSQRNPVPWDVYMLDLKTGEEQFIVRNGNVPTWSEDGKKIRFQRQGNQFVEIDVATKKEKMLFATGRNIALPPSVLLETPVWSDARHELAVTLRGSMRATSVIKQDGSVQRVAGGCELNWAPDSNYLYHVGHGGNGGNTFFKVDPDTLRRTVWFDSPSAYSHEYFPKVGNRGEYLVYGASTGGHEHDRADYEIFLWRIGRPAVESVRLSYHTGNDCWPDIFLY